MSRTPFLASSDAESFSLKLGILWSKFVVTGNATDTAVTATTVNPAFKIFLEAKATGDSGAEATVDSGATFGTLDVDADPAVIGFIGTVGDAAEVYTIEPHIIAVASGMTAAVHTLCGVSSSGVTLSKNIAFTESCTGMDLVDAAPESATFSLTVFYRKV